jgi:hypothetical protein
VTTASSRRHRSPELSEEVRIRFAYPDDLLTVRRLAALDSQPSLDGDVLIADVDGVAVAALSVQDGRVVADPFAYTEAVIDLLRLRASRAAPTPAPAAARVTRRLRASNAEPKHATA